MTKMNKKFTFCRGLVAWMVLAILSCYVRLYPLRAHLWDDARDQATLMVIYKLKQTFLQQVMAQAPNMPPALAAHLADEKLNATLHKDNQQFTGAVDRVTGELMAQPGAPAQKIYLLESDPYDFYDLTDNIVKTGSIASIIKGSNILIP